TGAARQLLPRNEVRVVLQLGGDDDVARAYHPRESVVPDRIGHQVDGLGGVLREHEFFGVGADEGGDVGAALLIGGGGLLHQLVRAAVHRAVGGGQKGPLGVANLQRPLRGGAGIQVSQLVS